jgi:hypothetical protein
LSGLSIQVIRLRPWARSYLGSRLESLQLPIDLIEQIRTATGGWSEIVSPLMERIGERPSEASATAKTRRPKGSKLDADAGSNLNAD